MLLLALDTSGDMVSVALMDNSCVQGAVQESMQRGHAERLMPIIDQVLKEAHVSFKEINAIAVTVGPGSFTGVRVGLAAAKAFGMSLNIPVLGVTCFEAFAFDLFQPVTVVLDTKRGDFFVQKFDAKGKAVSKPIVASADALKKNLPFKAVGSAASRLQKEIGCQLIQGNPQIAVSVGKIALSRLDHPMPAKPMYLREADVKV